MKRKVFLLITLGGIVAVVAGLVGTGVIDQGRLWAWCRHYFYQGRSAVARATTIRPPASKDPRAARICRQNLRHIENAKRKVAQERGMAAGRLTWEDILPELPGHRIPKCPAGGEYRLNDIGVMPQCSIGANETPQRDDDHLLINY